MLWWIHRHNFHWRSIHTVNSMYKYQACYRIKLAKMLTNLYQYNLTLANLPISNPTGDRLSHQIKASHPGCSRTGVSAIIQAVRFWPPHDIKPPKRRDTLMGRLNRLTLFNRFRDPNVTANVHNWRQLASSHHNKAYQWKRSYGRTMIHCYVCIRAGPPMPCKAKYSSRLQLYKYSSRLTQLA